MAFSEIKVGCDPELFLRDKKSGQIVSAYGLLPGTKHNPYPVKFGAVQIDGCATEFNIDPASSEAEWHNNIVSVISQMKAMLPNTVELVDYPIAFFDPKYFNALPGQAKAMGCEPDFDAYTGRANERPVTDKPMRTAGGHIHVGWREGADIDDADHIADCTEVVKQLDFYLGVPSLMWDQHRQRRELYGNAGAFRVKPYGVEYRSLSCMWVLDPVIRGFVFKATQGAVMDLYRGSVARVALPSSWAKMLIDGPADSKIVDPYILYRCLPFFRDFKNSDMFAQHCLKFSKGHAPSPSAPNRPDSPDSVERFTRCYELARAHVWGEEDL